MRINDSLMVDWHHNTTTKETICQLIDIDNNVIASGIAKAGHGDQFCKRTGRKLALTRALKQCNYDKTTRAKIWTVIKNRGVKIY